MATFHCQVKPISRQSKRSAVASAAYRSGTRLKDRASGVIHDYTHRQDEVLHKEILLPQDAAQQAELDWARDREELWNRAEAAEERPDARVAREYEVSLPHELTPEQQVVLARQFAQDISNRYGVAADWAIHQPGKEGDGRNYHAHILTTTREVSARGLERKTALELSHEDRKAKGLDSTRAEIRWVRQQWEWRANEALKAHGHEARIDARSLKEQGVDREPSRYKGPRVTARDRQEKRVREASVEKPHQAEAARTPPREMTEAESNAAIQEKWLKRREERLAKGDLTDAEIQERWLKRREERLRDPEGYQRREREKEREREREIDREYE